MSGSSTTYPVTFPRTLGAGEDAMATLTRPTPALWVLRMHSGVDNREPTIILFGICSKLVV